MTFLFPKSVSAVRIVLLLVIVVLALIRLALPPLQAQTADVVIVVDTPVDAVPPDLADGACSLREAIQAANAELTVGDCVSGPGSQEIRFDAAYTINAEAAFPPIDNPNNFVFINGFSPVGTVVLDGTLAPGTDSGLIVDGSGNFIRGLTIIDFPGSGIVLRDGASDNTIGGITADQRNRIYANGADGITVTGATTTGNLIIGNFIGTNDPGTGTIVNERYGISIEGGANGNTIGGPALADPVQNNANTISGNQLGGVLINAADDNVIQGNSIGDPADATMAPAIQTDGVTVSGGSANTLILENVIDANGLNGIVVTGAGTTGTQILDNQVAIFAPNFQSGILLTGSATATTIANNAIGFSTDLAFGSGNVVHGISLNSSNANIIGPGNVIALNAQVGVYVENSTDNQIVDNLISQNPNQSGISLVAALNTTITDNQISGNGGDGVQVVSGTANTISVNNIFDNGDIGIDLDADGVTPNDVGDGDAGPNDLQNYPVFTVSSDGTTSNIVGTVEAVGTFLIELFNNTPPPLPTVILEGETVLTQFASEPDGTFVQTLGVDLSGGFLTGTATNTNGSTSEFSPAVTVDELAALFTPDVLTGVAPLTVTFTDQTISSEPIASYLWDFGDGQTSTFAGDVIHTFDAPGTYVVNLRVTNVNGNFDDAPPVTIVVVAPTPTPLPTNTPVPLPTSTPVLVVPSPTDVLMATNTPLPSDTPTVMPSATATSTNTVTASPTATVTATSTNTATFTVTPSATATSTNTATFTVTPSPTVTATNTPPPTATNTPLPTSTPLPTVTTTVEPPDIDVDRDQIDDDTLVIVVENNGGTPLEDVELVEELRPGVVFVSSIPGDPFCLEAGGVVTCSLGTIGPGDDADVEITVDSDGVDILSGRTTITAQGIAEFTQEAPYLIKLGQPPFAQPGDTVTYTLRVINPTDETIGDILVIDTLPDAVTILEASADNGTVTVAGQDIRFQQASLAPGGRTTITILTELAQDVQAAEVINEACLTTSDNPEPSCATFGFFRAQTLPATGESPLTHLRVPALVVGLLVLVWSGGLIYRRARRA